ncbi:MAG: hypothetical protein KDB60_10860 [Propionibacteriaceae bacterium]|nr:hypothetical protein [Propionibacteriaceae bacterium]
MSNQVRVALGRVEIPSPRRSVGELGARVGQAAGVTGARAAGDGPANG